MSKNIEQYYNEYGKKVYLYLMSICHNHDTAEELTQETFYQALKSLKTYNGKCSVYTWLCAIAKNMWLKELERRKRHPIAEPDENKSSAELLPFEKIELKSSAMHLLKQIHTLPEHEKELILLRATGELSFKEIGEIFGKTENWARVTYYRAKQKLHKEE
ncbi:MAG: sigma-70 family RNA polymerase sigma factor [Ruminococcus sp.]|nr:sigma-70 family RNA polymerase sigma factor [Ruminococcus sp.]